jgi:hypothetical protein
LPEIHKIIVIFVFEHTNIIFFKMCDILNHNMGAILKQSKEEPTPKSWLLPVHTPQPLRIYSNYKRGLDDGSQERTPIGQCLAI